MAKLILLAAVFLGVLGCSHQIERVENSVGMGMVRLEPGEFVMGARINQQHWWYEEFIASHKNARSEWIGLGYGNGLDKVNPQTMWGYLLGRDSAPRHKVKISKTFYMQDAPVTNIQWDRVMGTQIRKGLNDETPVVNVSWVEASEFCEKLSRIEGKTYRLPTEAQWEYCCRAGLDVDETPTDEAYAWPQSLKKEQIHPVKQKKSNRWGLYDMMGNGAQWCDDYYNPGVYLLDAVDPRGTENRMYAQSRVIRAQGYMMLHLYMSSHQKEIYFSPAQRNYWRQELKNEFLGFRVVMEKGDK